jgi:pimeloyl-ACP methyl ester carboxylesterase
VFVTGEYNWGVQPGLKNLTDHFLEEWFWRPAAIVSYSAGRLSGARAATAWHGTLSEMGMVVVSSTIGVGPIGQTLSAEGDPLEKAARRLKARSHALPTISCGGWKRQRRSDSANSRRIDREATGKRSGDCSCEARRQTLNTSSEKIDLHRRHIIGTAAAQIGMFATVAVLCSSIAPGYSQGPPEQKQKAEIGFFQIDKIITLRRMVVHNPRPKGTVLFLHGFPETLYAWKDISLALADDYEVHAFDWPGYGLSSRPTVDKFSYAPKDFARVLNEYIVKAGIDTSKLTIYATDIGALPALLLALEKPDIARTIIVGDFAPFNRPLYMYESLQNLKAAPSADQVRAQLNKNREEILENTFGRGLPKDAQFEVSQEFKDDMARGWNQGAMTTADAFSHYYSYFTRDQDHFESQLARLKTPVKVVWGEKDLYIKKEMGVELAERVHAELTLLPGIGHYPHLQNPKQTIDEVRASFR